MIRALHDRLRHSATTNAGVALAVTFGFVGAAVGLRLLLQPLLGSSHVYIAFYLAVVLTAFIAGRWAGFLAMALSGALAFWLFEAPAFQLKASPSALTPFLFFICNTSVAVYLITGLREAVTRIAREQGRAEAAARRNADLFRELNEQVAHHLQLVSGVLALQADDVSETRIAQALAKASETSLMLARAHRDCAGREAELVEFLPFARHLVDAKLASEGLGPAAIDLSGESLRLPADQATSLGAALLECLAVVLNPRQPNRFGLDVRRCEDGVVLRISDLNALSGAEIEGLADGCLLRAAVEQLGARVAIAPADAGDAIEILFRPAGAFRAKAPGNVTLH